MVANGGIIGKVITPSFSTAVGVYDTFDQYNSRLKNLWPPAPKITSISPSSPVSINEGSGFSFSVVTDGYVNGSVLYYTIATNSGTINTSDFTDVTLSGSFTITSNSGSVTKILTFDEISEVSDSFVVQIRSGSTSGPILITSAVITINNPLFSVTPSSGTFNEGSTVTFNVSTTFVNNQTLFYSLSGISTADIASGSLTGSFSLTSGVGAFSITGVNDLTTEGNETITCNIRINSTVGPIVATTTVSLIDTSMTPSAVVTPNASSVNEGGAISFAISTTNFPTGTLFWDVSTISGNIIASDFSSGGLSGTVSITASAGTVNFTVAADTFDEGTEVFVLNVRLGSAVGAIIGTSSQVTINDTSTGGGSEPTALYTFTTVTFNAALTGLTGPTLAQAQGAMTGTPTPSAWNTNAAYFTVTSGIQLWTVPVTATYRILAAGASGLPSSSTTNRGASIRGDFSLTQGQKLRIVVGQTSTGSGTGGGGGSYVIKETGSTTADIYVIAGGGGGKSGGAGGTATTANSSNTVSNGNGGLGTSSSWGGPSGGGFFTSGGPNTGSQPGGGSGRGFLQGSAGGTPGSAPGGFGGGGGGGQDGGAGGGCGGGYSGGSSGGDGSNGQGAGSYPNGTNQSNTANSQAGGGLVTITKL